jgi:hypothetical protein
MFTLPENSTAFPVEDACSYMDVAAVCQYGRCVVVNGWPVCKCNWNYYGEGCSMKKQFTTLQTVSIQTDLICQGLLEDIKLSQAVSNSFKNWAVAAFQSYWYIDVTSITVSSLRLATDSDKCEFDLLLPVVTSTQLRPYWLQAVLLLESYSQLHLTLASDLLLNGVNTDVNKTAPILSAIHSFDAAASNDIQTFYVDNVCSAYDSLHVCTNGSCLSASGLPSCKCGDFFVGQTCNKYLDFIDLKITLSTEWMNFYYSSKTAQGLIFEDAVFDMLNNVLLLNLNIVDSLNILRISKVSTGSVVVEFRVNLQLSAQFTLTYESYLVKANLVRVVYDRLSNDTNVIKFNVKLSQQITFEVLSQLSYYRVIEASNERIEVVYTKNCSMLNNYGICQNGGMCLLDVSETTAACSCPIGYSGNSCQITDTMSTTNEVKLNFDINFNWVPSLADNANSATVNLLSSIANTIRRTMIVNETSTTMQLWVSDVQLSSSSNTAQLTNVTVTITYYNLILSSPDVTWKSLTWIGDRLISAFILSEFPISVGIFLSGDISMIFVQNTSPMTVISLFHRCSIMDALNVCQNGGTCLPTNDVTIPPMCNCLDGYIGESCSISAGFITFRIFPDLIWIQDYQDKYNTASMQLASMVKSAMYSLYSSYSAANMSFDVVSLDQSADKKSNHIGQGQLPSR